jgi:hypothetical protein
VRLGLEHSRGHLRGNDRYLIDRRPLLGLVVLAGQPPDGGGVHHSPGLGAERGPDRGEVEQPRRRLVGLRPPLELLGAHRVGGVLEAHRGGACVDRGERSGPAVSRIAGRGVHVVLVFHCCRARSAVCTTDRGL